MNNIKKYENIINTAIVCLAIIIGASLIIFAEIKRSQLQICKSITNEQIRADCVRTTR